MSSFLSRKYSHKNPNIVIGKPVAAVIGALSGAGVGLALWRKHAYVGQPALPFILTVSALVGTGIGYMLGAPPPQMDTQIPQYNPVPVPFGSHKGSAKGLFRMFNHGESKGVRDVDVSYLPPDKELFAIGRLQSLVYVPYKSSRKPHEAHIHSFGDFGDHEDYAPEKFPLLAGDAEGNLHIIRNKSPYYLDSRGIVG